MKNALKFDLPKTFCCKTNIELLYAEISLSKSCLVCILSRPTLSFLFILPLSLSPAIILFWILFPSKSFAIPILLEKKGLASLPFPSSVNRSLFSMKNCLFSGRDISNLVRLVTCWSTSTWEKSGFTVKSRVKELSRINLASPPNSKSSPLIVFWKSLYAMLLIYGIKDFFETDFPRGLSKYMSPVKAKLKNIKFSGARLQVIHELFLVFLM